MALIGDVFSELDGLLAPITGASPTGVDLDGTLELNALEMASLEPEEPVVEGVERVDERNWRQIHAQAAALLAKSKDLRVAAVLTRALLQLEGLPGYCAGLCFVSDLAQQHWDALYPPLDADDGDATMRINALHELVNPPSLDQLRVARVFAAEGGGLATVNDLLLATASALGRPELSQAPSHIVFSIIDGLGAEKAQAHLVLIQKARTQLAALTAFVAERTGTYLQLGALTALPKKNPLGLLDALAQGLAVECERLAGSKNKQGAAAPSDDDDDDAATGGPRRSLGDIARREDVIMLIERICAYYARVEPSSPVPLLLQRAKRLASMDFLAIVRDMAEQGLPQVGTVAGIALEANGSMDGMESMDM
ncbi:MAG: type VI secretion system protein TssA [Polyangiales bacterium]